MRRKLRIPLKQETELIHRRNITCLRGFPQQGCGRVEIAPGIGFREIERSHHVQRLRIVQFCALREPALGFGFILHHADSGVIDFAKKASRESAAFLRSLMEESESCLLILLGAVAKKIGNAEIHLGVDQPTGGGELIPVKGAHRIFGNADACLIEIADLELRLGIAGSGRLFIPEGGALQILRHTLPGKIFAGELELLLNCVRLKSCWCCRHVGVCSRVGEHARRCEKKQRECCE